MHAKKEFIHFFNVGRHKLVLETINKYSDIKNICTIISNHTHFYYLTLILVNYLSQVYLISHAIISQFNFSRDWWLFYFIFLLLKFILSSRTDNVLTSFIFLHKAVSLHSIRAALNYFCTLNATNRPFLYHSPLVSHRWHQHTFALLSICILII